MIRLAGPRESRWALAAASFGYVGYFPWAPGTAGSVAAMVPLWFLRETAAGWRLLLVVAVFGLGVAVSGRAAAVWGRKDPGRVVIDEVVGYWVTMLFVPMTPFFFVAGLLLFRLFDIVKPWGIRRLETELPTGLAIMADDVAAGLLANLCLQVLRAAGA